MAKIDLKDESAVAIIGAGAGGGTRAHELTRRGIKVVLLEAGKRQSLDTFHPRGSQFGCISYQDSQGEVVHEEENESRNDDCLFELRQIIELFAASNTFPLILIGGLQRNIFRSVAHRQILSFPFLYRF